MMMMIPIEMTLVGIVTDFSEEQPWNARVPNDRDSVSINTDNSNDSNETHR